VEVVNGDPFGLQVINVGIKRWEVALRVGRSQNASYTAQLILPAIPNQKTDVGGQISEDAYFGLTSLCSAPHALCAMPTNPYRVKHFQSKIQNLKSAIDGPATRTAQFDIFSRCHYTSTQTQLVAVTEC